jgi:hypothetical protein
MKLEQLFANARANGGKWRAFDVNQTLILLEISRDAIHYLVRMAVGCFMRMVLFMNNCKDGTTESLYLSHLENLANHSRLIKKASYETLGDRTDTGHSTFKDLEIPLRTTISNSSNHNGAKTESEDQASISNIPKHGTINSTTFMDQNAPAIPSRSIQFVPKFAETESWNLRLEVYQNL